MPARMPPPANLPLPPVASFLSRPLTANLVADALWGITEFLVAATAHATCAPRRRSRCRCPGADDERPSPWTRVSDRQPAIDQFKLPRVGSLSNRAFHRESLSRTKPQIASAPREIAKRCGRGICSCCRPNRGFDENSILNASTKWH